MNVRRAAVLAVAVATLYSRTAGADLSTVMRFNIVPQALSAALLKYSEQCRIQVTSPAELIDGRTSGGVVGELSAKDALARLLEGSQLSYEVIDANTVAIRDPKDLSVNKASAEERKEYELALAQTSTGRFVDSAGEHIREPLATSVAEDPNESSGALKVDEIVVTAQKRVERLQEVPVPVTAVGADVLVNQGHLGLREYFTRVPGLMFMSANRGEPLVVMRGITTAPLATPTVGFTIDDVPYSPTLALAGGFMAPDLDPSDLARIEVLRGPQGTLYGASSMGGLIKYVTVDPSFAGVSGKIQAGINSIRGGDELGYTIRGRMNLPLGDTLAMNASAHIRVDPGYIDNPSARQRDVNRGDATGGRVSALWRPSEAFSLKVGAIVQEKDIAGASLVYRLPGLGDLEQRYAADSGWLRRNYQAFSANASAQLGETRLDIVSGYSRNTFSDSVDLAVFLGGLANSIFGVTGAPYIERYDNSKFTQEVRLTIPMADRIEWLIGAFYTDEDCRHDAHIAAVDPTSGAVAGILVPPSNWWIGYEEYAAFVNLTYRFTERFDVQIGGRQSHNRQTHQNTASGGGRTASIAVEDEPFTYLLTPRWRISPDLMVYARLASGYRPGGTNPNSRIYPTIPRDYEADTTQNYEVGAKGNLLSRAVTVDASLYYIDWKDLQLGYLSPAGVAFDSNGSRAKSQGLELSIQAMPLTGLTITAAGSWSDARLTEDFGPRSPILGFKGDRLPFNSRFTGSLSVDQEFPLPGGLTGSIGGTVSYVGARQGALRPTRVRQQFPSYMQGDLRAGLRLATWSANVFVSNLTDKRGVLGGGIGAIDVASFSITQPRTIGMLLSREF